MGRYAKEVLALAVLLAGIALLSDSQPAALVANAEPRRTLQI